LGADLSSAIDHISQLNDGEANEIDSILDDARECKKFLNTMLEPIGLTEGVHSYKLRVKQKKSLARKIVDKRKDGRDDYAISSVGDVVGLRLITNFPSQQFHFTKRVEQLLCNESIINPSPFAKGSLSEVTIYRPSVTGTNDGTFAQITEYLESKEEQGNFKIFNERREDMYSGIHILGKILSPKMNGDPVPIEVQIRSIFEDVWAEISHNLYEITRMFESDSNLISPLINSHMQVLKNILDASGNYTDLIQDEVQESIRKAASEISANPDRSDLSTQDDVQEAFKHMNVDADAAERFFELLEFKKELDTALQSRSPGRHGIEYYGAAERFYSLYSEQAEAGFLRGDGALNESQMAYFYYLRMEEALCRLMLNVEEEIESAIDIYVELMPVFPESATLYFRLAQAYVQLGRFDEAINNYVKSGELVSKLKDLPKEERYINLTNTQKTYLLGNWARLLGFAYWRRSTSLLESEPGNETEIVIGFRNAYECAKSGLDHDLSQDDRSRLLNSTVYFGAELFLNDHSESKKRRAEFAELVSEFSDMVDTDDKNNIKSIDTLCFALSVLGLREEAKNVALRILDIIVEIQDDENFISGSKIFSSKMQRNIILRRAVNVSKGRELPGYFPIT